MKKLLLIISIFLISQTYIRAQGSWSLFQTPVQDDLRKIFFVDSTYGWIAGDSGVILKTTNSGLNWSLQNRNTSYYFNDIFFVDRNIGWALAWRYNFNQFGTFFFKTTNGGLNWTSTLYPDTMVFAQTIFFLNQNTGYFGTASSPFRTIYKTTNAGVNWSPGNIDSGFVSNFPVRDIFFLNANTGVAVGGFIDIAAVAWYTTNAGNNWISAPIGSEPLFCVRYINNKFIAMGGDFEYGLSYAETSNSGVNWNYKNIDIFGMALSFDFRNVNEGWASSGFSQKLVYTTDAGVRWFPVDSPDSSTVNWLQFANENIGYAVCNKGKILKYSTSTGIIKFENEITDNFVLHPNFPNPFNSSTLISYSIPSGGDIKIEIIDITGRNIKTISRQLEEQGRYYEKLELNEITSGIYFYRVTLLRGSSDMSSRTGKMIFLK